MRTRKNSGKRREATKQGRRISTYTNFQPCLSDLGFLPPEVAVGRHHISPEFEETKNTTEEAVRSLELKLRNSEDEGVMKRTHLIL